jgi:uncharacterized protein YpmS
MKWIRRIILLLATLLLAVVILLAASFYLIHRTPTWYKPLGIDSQEMEAAANRAFNKVVAIHNMADQAAAQDSAREHGAASRPAVEPITVEFTQEELTAFIIRWSTLHSEQVDRYLTGAQFILHDGQIIFACKLAGLDQIGALKLSPSLDDEGLLHLDIDSISIGSLPVARSLLQGRLQKVEAMLEQWLPQWQTEARIQPGGANSDAMKAAMTELFLNSLNDKPSPAVFFMPIGEHKNVPVKVSGLTVRDGAIALTVQPLRAEERKAAMEIICKPYPGTAKPSDTANAH